MIVEKSYVSFYANFISLPTKELKYHIDLCILNRISPYSNMNQIHALSKKDHINRSDLFYKQCQMSNKGIGTLNMFYYF